MIFLSQHPRHIRLKAVSSSQECLENGQKVVQVLSMLVSRSDSLLP